MKGSYFDGTFLGYIGIHLLAGLISVLTLGIAAPWSYCLIKGWELEHRVINNRRLKFTGNGVEAVGTWILLLIVTYLALGAAAWITWKAGSTPNVQRVMGGVVVVAAALYVPFVRLLILKWFSKHTIFDDRGPGSGVPMDDFIPATPVVQQYTQSSTVTKTSNNAPLAPFILGVFISVIGLAVGMLYHWAGLIAAVGGIVILIFAYIKQN